MPAIGGAVQARRARRKSAKAVYSVGAADVRRGAMPGGDGQPSPGFVTVTVKRGDKSFTYEVARREIDLVS